MWHAYPGPVEVILLAIIATVLLLLGTRARRWAVGVLPCLVIGMVVTPPDFFSMLIVSVPLIAVFACGVFMARYIRGPAVT